MQEARQSLSPTTIARLYGKKCLVRAFGRADPPNYQAQNDGSLGIASVAVVNNARTPVATADFWRREET